MRWFTKGGETALATEGCEPEMQFRRLGMADRELIAAILTAGMLPTMEIPQSRAQSKGRPLTKAEADTIQRAVDHAFGVDRLVLNGLGVDPLAGLPEQISTDTSGDGGVQNRVKLSGEH
jgi:hypothetical protein